jgi:hypothetical protein
MSPSLETLILQLPPNKIIPQLLIFPIGRLWARTMPNIKIFGAPLNPGLFSIKEHVLATIMASVGAGSAYATDIVAVQRVFYNQTYNFGCAFVQPVDGITKLKLFFRSMDACYVYPAHWLFNRGHLSSLFG